MHTMWKGTISFGLVNIPIKLHAATENKDIKLRQLHQECKSPIEYKKRCPVCDREVDHEEIVKAYEYAKNKFVVLDEEDLQALKKEQEDKAVEIMDFVKLEEIDPIYFERSYFMSPNEGGSKAYGLLRKALEDTGKIGIAKIIIRSKEQLAVVRVYQNTLLMETIHFPDEVRNVQEVPNVPEDIQLSKKELSTAVTLIDQLTAQFEPEKYKDDYRTALLDLIDAKRNNEEVTTAKDRPKPDNVTDLMEALEKSLEKTKGAKKKTTKRKTAPKTKKKTS
ncbi:Ku protein [Halobacillus yeomjeoni]|uniref:Non-homologous end joining protein Ku n=1 Tax=Halobacillus yeomjeoni TaxID=311194 RepID=A0A931HV58_9BACI|nr:Ku protein [Halobacillus yeomjeoni]MBH0230357.1 Ku protein [Halobacillus yeomjeoni]